MTKAVVLRFTRVFVSGFLAGVTVYLGAGVQVKDLTEIKVIAVPLIIAGLTAGLAALDKAYRFVPDETVSEE